MSLIIFIDKTVCPSGFSCNLFFFFHTIDAISLDLYQIRRERDRYRTEFVNQCKFDFNASLYFFS